MPRTVLAALYFYWGRYFYRTIALDFQSIVDDFHDLLAELAFYLIRGMKTPTKTFGQFLRRRKLSQLARHSDSYQITAFLENYAGQVFVLGIQRRTHFLAV